MINYRETDHAIVVTQGRRSVFVLHDNSVASVARARRVAAGNTFTKLYACGRKVPHMRNEKYIPA